MICGISTGISSEKTTFHFGWSWMSFEVTLGGAWRTWRSDGNARMSLEELRGGWRSHGNRPIETLIETQEIERRLKESFWCFIHLLINNLVRFHLWHLKRSAAVKQTDYSDAIQVIIQAYIFPHITYCLSVCAAAAKGQLHKIQKVINFAARLVTGLKKYHHITPALNLRPAGGGGETASLYVC